MDIYVQDYTRRTILKPIRTSERCAALCSRLIVRHLNALCTQEPPRATFNLPEAGPLGLFIGDAL